MNRSPSPARPAPLLALACLAAALAAFTAGCGDRRQPADKAAQEPASRDAEAPATDPAAEAAALDSGPRAAESLQLSAPLAATGQMLFDAKGCTGCHQLGSDQDAPDLRGVASRRTEAWLRRQVTDPEWMAAHDPATRAMVERYGVPMADLDVSADEATALLHFMLREDSGR